MVSSAAVSAPAPVPLAIARSMLSLGIEASRAFCTASASEGLPSMSPPPSFAATVTARASLVKSLPRLESTIAFLCLIEAHLECRDTPRILVAPQGEVPVEDLRVAGPVVDGEVQADAMAGRRADPRELPGGQDADRPAV